MKIVVFGATGIAGMAIVEEALRKGHDVTILTRDARKMPLIHKRLHIVQGDVTDRDTVHRLLEGQQAVIQTLGIGGKGTGAPTTFVSEATRLIMEEMAATNVKRLIAISAIGAGESLYYMPWIYRKVVMPVFMKWFMAIIDDKNRMEELIRKTSLEWTIVRCTTIKDRKPTGKITATTDGKGITFSIAAADMARFMVAQLEDKSYIGQSPTICQ